MAAALQHRAIHVTTLIVYAMMEVGMHASTALTVLLIDHTIGETAVLVDSRTAMIGAAVMNATTRATQAASHAHPVSTTLFPTKTAAQMVCSGLASAPRVARAPRAFA